MADPGAKPAKKAPPRIDPTIQAKAPEKKPNTVLSNVGITIGGQFISAEGIGLNESDVEKSDYLGRGTMGYVCKARNKNSGELFALKAMEVPADATEEDEQARRLLGNELHLLLSCKINEIVTFKGCYFVSPTLYLGMELMEAGSISSLVAKATKKGLTPPNHIPDIVLAKVAYCVAKALDYIDQQRAIHRDIKPDNILVNRRGEIKLGDFGVCNYKDGGRTSQPGQYTTVVGTRRYLSPERVDPDNAAGYGIKADVWSLGISIIELATAAHPYFPKGTKMDPEGFALLNKILNEDPPRMPASYSPVLADFVDACLAKPTADPAEGEVSRERVRSSPAQLLQHPLLANLSADNSAVVTWLDSILGPEVAPAPVAGS